MRGSGSVADPWQPIRLRARPPSTWSTPRWSRPSQLRGSDFDSGGSGCWGASVGDGWLAGGDGVTASGSVAVAGGALRRGSPWNQCHHLSHLLLPQGLELRAQIIRDLSSWLSRVAGSAAHASNALLVFQGLLTHQGEEGLEAGSVAGARIKLDSGGKQSASIEASSCLPLAFCCLSQAVSCLSCSVSFSICLVSLSICFIRSSCCILRCS